MQILVDTHRMRNGSTSHFAIVSQVLFGKVQTAGNGRMIYRSRVDVGELMVFSKFLFNDRRTQPPIIFFSTGRERSSEKVIDHYDA